MAHQIHTQSSHVVHKSVSGKCNTRLLSVQSLSNTQVLSSQALHHVLNKRRETRSSSSVSVHFLFHFIKFLLKFFNSAVADFCGARMQDYYYYSSSFGLNSQALLNLLDLDGSSFALAAKVQWSQAPGIQCGVKSLISTLRSFLWRCVSLCAILQHGTLIHDGVFQDCAIQ
jgi:hypothetical protein